MYLIECGKVIMVVGFVVVVWVMVIKCGNRIGICMLDDCFGWLEVMLFIDVLDKY